MGRVIGPFAASGVASASSLSIPFLVGAVVSLGGALLIHTRPKAKPPSESSSGAGPSHTA
jgi:hypothetical protein